MQPSLIASLKLQDFRNFTKKEFSFHPLQTLILGKNGRGKTNVLEGISLLSTGKSFRGKLLSECIRLGEKAAHIEISAEVENEEIILSLAMLAADRATTRYQKNGVKKRKADVVGTLKSVIFRPQDQELVTGSPSGKRQYLDEVLMQVDKKYVLALHEYERALKHRNKLILKLREGLASRRDFIFWDELLIRHGDTLTRARANFLHYLNSAVDFPLRGKVDYDSSIMSEERLHKYATAEVAAGKTLVGPHKDSFIVNVGLNGDNELHNVALFGSRGQQRLVVLWLKLGQLQFLETETKISPILLLDDIFSELDDVNREIIFPLFTNHQVILTSAEQLEILPPECRMGGLIQL